jgi:pimeloyl-ACP methyl ester carboxylesterase
MRTALWALMGVVAASSVQGRETQQYRNVEVALAAVSDARGERLRTLVTVPRAKEGRSGTSSAASAAKGGKLPAIFVVGWLSCDSVELKAGARDGVSRLLLQVIEESGALVMRVDKPGVGESEGNCAETDFDTELSGYRAAFAALRAHPRVDTARIVMLGISNGGGFSPLVADSTRVAGYVSVGGWSKTWFEHMIELERRRLALEGRPPGTATAELKQLAQFHAAYLLDQRTPAQVIAAHPELQPVWYDEPEHQYGRPAAFYHQLQALDLAAAWSRVDARALIVWGEYDWIMSHDDQTMIVDLVNARRPGSARLLAVPAMDHSFSTHPSAKAAYDRMGAGDYPTVAAAEILRFIREVTNAS